MLKLIAAVLILTTPAVAAELPDAPSAQPVTISSSLQPAIASSQIKVVRRDTRLTKVDYALYAGVLVYRTGDYFTTRRILKNGGHEYEMPYAVVSTGAGFATFSAGMAAIEIGSSVYLHRHGHAKMARWIDTLSVGGGSATVTSNWVHLGILVENDREFFRDHPNSPGTPNPPSSPSAPSAPSTGCTVGHPCGGGN